MDSKMEKELINLVKKTFTKAIFKTGSDKEKGG